MAAITPVKPKAVVEIERLGIRYREESQFDLSLLSPERRVQVRESKHYAPRDGVNRYAVQMGESEFPPIIVTEDGWIIDGNTRVGACEVRKVKFFPAYVLEMSWGQASQKRQYELVALAATLNAQNGNPLTDAETRRVVRAFVELGWKQEQIARAIGSKQSVVTGVRKEIEAENKLARVGITANGELKGASLRALGSKPVLALNDQPYRELAQLAADAGFNAGEINSLAKEAAATGSDSGAITVIQDARRELGDRIREQSLTGSAKPPTSRQLRQHLGFVNKFVGREQELLETNPEVGAQHADVLERAIKILDEVLRMQRG